MKIHVIKNLQLVVVATRCEKPCNWMTGFLTSYSSVTRFLQSIRDRNLEFTWCNRNISTRD